jgi:hypothetical protein
MHLCGRVKEIKLKTSLKIFHAGRHYQIHVFFACVVVGVEGWMEAINAQYSTFCQSSHSTPHIIIHVSVHVTRLAALHTDNPIN